MKTLIVSATYNEVSLLIKKLSLKKETDTFYISEKFNVFITGIGSAFTIYKFA